MRFFLCVVLSAAALWSCGGDGDGEPGPNLPCRRRGSQCRRGRQQRLRKGARRLDARRFPQRRQGDGRGGRGCRRQRQPLHQDPAVPRERPLRRGHQTEAYGAGTRPDVPHVCQGQVFGHPAGRGARRHPVRHVPEAVLGRLEIPLRHQPQELDVAPFRLPFAGRRDCRDRLRAGVPLRRDDQRRLFDRHGLFRQRERGEGHRRTFHAGRRAYPPLRRTLAGLRLGVADHRVDRQPGQDVRVVCRPDGGDPARGAQAGRSFRRVGSKAVIGRWRAIPSCGAATIRPSPRPSRSWRSTAPGASA